MKETKEIISLTHAASSREVSAVDRLVDGLRAAILEGRLVAGQRLVEADITAEYEVSRGPARVALVRLAAEGIVEILPHKGARVRHCSNEELLFTFELREVLEGLAARVAARAGSTTADLISDLREQQHRMGAALDQGRLEEYIRVNAEFHTRIVLAANQPMLGTMVRQLQTQALRTLLQYRMNASLLRRSYADHELIIKYIASSEEERAEEAMRAHIRAARSELVVL